VKKNPDRSLDPNRLGVVMALVFMSHAKKIIEAYMGLPDHKEPGGTKDEKHMREMLLKARYTARSAIGLLEHIASAPLPKKSPRAPRRQNRG